MTGRLEVATKDSLGYSYTMTKRMALRPATILFPTSSLILLFIRTSRALLILRYAHNLLHNDKASLMTISMNVVTGAPEEPQMCVPEEDYQLSPDVLRAVPLIIWNG